MENISHHAIVRLSCFALGVFIFGPTPSRASEMDGKQRQDAVAKWNTPLLFARSSGSSDESIQYVGAAPGIRASFQDNCIAFRIQGSAFQLQFLGSSKRAQPEGQDPQPTRVNYLVGDQPQDWSQDLPTYQKVVYHGLYPGIDAEFSFAGGHMKSEFVVAPGSDPARIRFQYVGLGSPHINQQGDATFELEQGGFREEAPEVYQWKQGTKVRVPARFALSGEGVISFELGAFDQAFPLVIDPVVSYSSYVGGIGDSAATAIAADSNGNTYVTGWPDSLNFPLLGPVQGKNAGSVDVFVLKLNGAGNTLLYATYIGGSGADRGYGIAIDGAGEAYVTGTTTSSNFPTHTPIQAGLRGSRNAFALKLNAAGNGFIFSMYLGGSAQDNGNAIAVDSQGNAYLTGDTTSSNFPTLGPVQATNLNAAGNAFIFSTYLGGSAQDNGNAIAVDSQGNAYLTGDTTSSNFPTLGPVQATNQGQQDAFVAELRGTGTLVYSTYLGGSGNDRGAAIAVDAVGSAYVTGGTFSNNFPTANALQAASGGGQDCFIAKLSPGGNSLVYSTYLGGSGGALGSGESGSGIAVDGQGNAFITGSTSSANFPTSAPLQLLPGGGTESAFAAKLNSSGSALVYSTYIGGSVMDFGTSIAIDLADKALVAG